MPSDSPAALACWEGSAPPFPPIPVRKKGCEGKLGCSHPFAQGKEPTSCASRLGMVACGDCTPNPREGMLEPCSSPLASQRGRVKPPAGRHCAQVTFNPSLSSGSFNEAESTPTPHLKRKVPASGSKLLPPGISQSPQSPARSPVLGQGAGEGSSNTAAGQTGQVSLKAGIFA